MLRGQWRWRHIHTVTIMSCTDLHKQVFSSVHSIHHAIVNCTYRNISLAIQREIARRHKHSVLDLNKTMLTYLWVCVDIEIQSVFLHITENDQHSYCVHNASWEWEKKCWKKAEQNMINTEYCWNLHCTSSYCISWKSYLVCVLISASPPTRIQQNSLKHFNWAL